MNHLLATLAIFASFDPAFAETPMHPTIDEWIARDSVPFTDDGGIGDGSEFQHIAAAAAALPQPPRAGQLRSARPALAEVPLADLS